MPPTRRASLRRVFTAGLITSMARFASNTNGSNAILMCGVRTNIVTAVEIRDKDASDTKLLPALVDATAQNFKLNEVSADKGYGSLKNYKAIQYHGATPYIAFKSIHTGRGRGAVEAHVSFVPIQPC